MTQTDQGNQNVNPPPDEGGNVQPGINPYNYPGNYYPQQWQQQGEGGAIIPPQQQSVGGGTSPEVPRRVEQSEQYITPESVTAPEKDKEKQRLLDKGAHEKEEVKDTVAEAAPDQKRFESPFKVYGYQVSQRAAAAGSKPSSVKVRGNTSFAKTWLIVLLGRLLRMNTGQVLSAS